MDPQGKPSTAGDRMAAREHLLAPLRDAATATKSQDTNAGDARTVFNLTPAPCLDALRGKVAVITGASSGIGKACANALANAGMRVVACARREDKLSELRDEIVRGGVAAANILPVRCDVQREDDIQSVMRQIEERWQCAPAVVINNAGLSREDTTILEGSTASWTEMMNTNVVSVAVMTREAVALMKQHGEYGHVINISSMSAYRIPKFAGGAFYAATKHALRCISEGTRIEAQQQGLPLRVSCVSPGVVETEFYQVRHGCDAEAAKSAYAFDALHTDHIVQAVLYALGAPRGVCVDDVIVRPMGQPL